MKEMMQSDDVIKWCNQFRSKVKEILRNRKVDQIITIGEETSIIINLIRIGIYGNMKSFLEYVPDFLLVPLYLEVYVTILLQGS